MNRKALAAFLYTITLLFCSNSLLAKSGDTILVYNRAGEQVSFQEVLDAAAEKKYVMFGELHGNPLAHRAELLLLQHLQAHHGERLILGMEMFEMDVQPIVDEYFSGLINKRSFETEARIWSNYSDYEPLVEFARENNLRLIASNVPRRYANSVYHQGVEVLNKLSRQAKRFFPRLPLKVDYDLPSYRSMASMLPDHATENFIASQALKDATMAMNINRHVKRNDVILHVHGAFHSTNGEGIIPYLKGVKPGQLILITTVMADPNGQVDPAEFAKAEYTLVSRANP